MRFVITILVTIGWLFGTAANANAAEKMTVILDWFVNPDHAPLIVAKQKGFFAAEGLDVTMIEPADPNNPPKLVAAGKADLAISYQPQLHLHVEAGLPLMRVATLVATPLMTLLVLEDGPIKQISDLKGKKVGFSVGGFEDVMLRTLFAKHGVSPGDVERINVNFSLSPSLISGQVDAVIGAYRNFELNQLEILGRKGRAFYVEEEGVPGYDELIVVAHKDTARSDKTRRFVTAMERAVQYLVNHGDDSWNAFKSYKKGLDDELNKRAWRDTLPRFALRPAALDRGRYTRFAKFMKAQGMLKSIVKLDTYAIDINQ